MMKSIDKLRFLRTVAVAALGPCLELLGQEVAPKLVAATEARLAKAPSIELAVCIRERSEVGLRKYGIRLRRGWKGASYGALQEAVDLLLYLEADEDASRRERALALELAEMIVARAARKTLVWDAHVAEQAAHHLARHSEPAPAPEPATKPAPEPAPAPAPAPDEGFENVPF
jgi:hypothetical protein